LVTIGDDARGNISTTSLVGAVAETIAKVWVLAEASSIGRGAPKLSGLGEHVVNAHLTTCWKVGLGSNGNNESTKGDNCGLHLDDWGGWILVMVEDVWIDGIGMVEEDVDRER